MLPFYKKWLVDIAVADTPTPATPATSATQDRSYRNDNELETNLSGSHSATHCYSTAPRPEHSTESSNGVAESRSPPATRKRPQVLDFFKYSYVSSRSGRSSRIPHLGKVRVAINRK
jgi:hypothetical protein